MHENTYKDQYTEEAFLGKIIYPIQFGGGTYKLAFHIVNTCYTGKGKDAIKYYMRITSMYSVSSRDVIYHDIIRILEKYDRTKKNRFRYDCFSHIQDILQPEDMCFLKNDKKRLVTLKE